MCLFKKIEINGKKYTPYQVKEMFAKMSRKIEVYEAEIEARVKENADLKGQVNVARAAYQSEHTKVRSLEESVANLKRQLEELPKRGKDGKFVKRD